MSYAIYCVTSAGGSGTTEGRNNTNERVSPAVYFIYGGSIMWILYLIIIAIILFCFPYLRYIVFHPIISIKHGFLDLQDYIKYKRYNECKEYGHIKMYTAGDAQAFGSGKTLSMVKDVRRIYHQYNNKKVWDSEKQEFVEQHIIIISNIEFKDIPYIPFIGKSQFINIEKIAKTEHDIVIFVLDEAGFVFNSREYKNNMPTDFLQRLLQVRHNRIGFQMSAQRFGFVDKILRQTTEVVTTCKKKWRIVRLQEYDAYALENCPNPLMIQPYCTKWYFCTNKLFNAYDTTYNVEKLKEEYESGELLTTSEILEKIGDNTNPEIVRNRMRRRFREKR